VLVSCAVLNERQLRGQKAPPQTLAVGQRVELRYDIGDYDGANYLRAGLAGTVIGYATPDIQRRQIWPAESYYVRLDCDAPDSIGRVLDSDRLRVLGSVGE
jgi:hypothetical protein